MSDLVIVESPAKANTIKKYLGKGFNVIASMGHIRDLPKSRMGVDVDNNFTPEYISIRGKAALIKSLKKEAKQSKKVYLATDPDREGEAISWHLSKILGIDEDAEVRVTFNEITKSAVKDGIKHPRNIDMNLVNAQQARRILDRIVGYNLSPFLWKKVKRGLSAGRVQSVAVRLIVDREDEIRAFEPQEYWTIEAAGVQTQNSKKTFDAKFFGDKNGKIEIRNKDQADEILEKVKYAKFVVAAVKKSERKRSPAPPFTTSTLQQEASKRLNFQAKRTMLAAQQLYEGIDIKGYGAIGLITYMRTDSLRIADEAKENAAKFISEQFGKDYLPEKPRVYKVKKGSQDAHEAIRPTVQELTPQKVKESLSNDQYKLYKLIWERFTASQMANEIFDTVSADIDAGGYIFKAAGSTVKFKGFAAVYEEADTEAMGKPLPALKDGDNLKTEKIDASQHFTQPPARFTEASLIKTLEENGIGRPSTYAPTITTILARGYVTRESRQLVPTPLGEVTTKLMKENFSDIVNVEFTAKMEGDLDRLEDGGQKWVDTLDNFYSGFEKTLKTAEEVLGDVHVKVPDEVSDVICENCGRNMVVKMGRYGKFLACPGYPECKNTKPILQETGALCPVCGGKVLQKKSKNGKTYFGCENNPKCPFMTWDVPKQEKCPKCGSSLFKKRGGILHCLKEGCGYEQERSAKGE
ncbi:MAG TPA: type I DNA topoisomerase [Ruminiclostridium sp.]|nr:type I DNA topoisomerase [Ruminiclostridium sp.]